MTTVRSVFLDGGERLADLMLDIHLANGNVILFTMASLAEDPAFQALWSSGDIYRPKPQGSGIVWPDGTYLPLKRVFSLL